MKKSLIWTAVSAGVIGIAVPAFAAVQTSTPQPSITTVKTTVEDVSGNCDEAEHANDPSCVTMVLPATPAARPSVTADDSTDNSIDDNSIDDNGITDNSVDDSTENSVDDNTMNSMDDTTSNSVEDVSGPCDEAEHANDPSCTNAAATVNSVDDSSARSGRTGAGDDSGHHGGGTDDSGHGGTHG